MSVRFMLWLVGVSLAAGLIAVALEAWGHDAPSGWRYPTVCCSATDCYHLEPGEVSWTPKGYRIEATGEVIPFEDTRRSPDGYFHRCSVGGDPERATKGVGFSRGMCLFAPEAGT